MSRIWTVIAREIRNAVPATIFFLWLFHMIALTKAVLLDDYSFTALRATFATVGALLVAKAILVVEAMPISRLFSGQLWFHLLWRTLLVNVVVLIFRYIEEIIPLIRKHESLLAATAQLYREAAWPQFAVLQLWLFCALFFYCVAAELVRTIGRERVTAMFFGPGGKAAAG